MKNRLNHSLPLSFSRIGGHHDLIQKIDVVLLNHLNGTFFQVYLISYDPLDYSIRGPNVRLIFVFSYNFKRQHDGVC